MNVTDASGSGGTTAVKSEVAYNGGVLVSLDAPLEISRWRVVGNPILAVPHLLIVAVLVAVSIFGRYVLFVYSLLLGPLIYLIQIGAGKGFRLPGVFRLFAGVQRYEWQVVTFFLFLREPYPSFALSLNEMDPGGDPAQISFISTETSWNPAATLWNLIRMVGVIPQILFGILLAFGLCTAMIGAFFSVLITGRWPAQLRRFVLGVLFWASRVNAWAFHLADHYPPFRIG